ncbi:thioredoxin-like protein 1 [Artemia franciscana]|uniref:Thioredoxin-like protein 1 n=1 Tax=Artemia franciscana TaxID=6661 RepID=A0AA88I755_ARTSF|nr:hypothetical protein QYM36_000044 [Artemia franciscana]KAK2725409.1 hypothetical protein QYM36_000044 [Artemia franciscana]KAK2725410.1 hypothetical protein QYM36_000044 [Artemia franciscana]
MVKEITEPSQLQAELNVAGPKLVVVDFTASWCGPCQRIAPFVDELSRKYTRAVFLKVDVDAGPDLAQAHNVSAMPTFIFFKNKVVIDRLQGANPQSLEEKVRKFYGSEDEEEDVVNGHVDLASFISKNDCECLNESDQHSLLNLLEKKGHLESDCDEQLIIVVSFNQPIKLHSIKIKAPLDSGPKDLKLYINQPKTLDFDSAESSQATQVISLSPKDLEGNPVNLRFVKFQNLQNLTMFVKNNQEDTDITKIEQLSLIGSPINTTNMTDFKRVAGKKGEAH